MSQELKKVIKMVKETGDRIVVFDPEESGDNFVVLPLEEYEKLAPFSRSKEEDISPDLKVKNLTENELIDKINRDIAAWKSENEDKRLDSYKIIENFLQSESLDRFGEKKEEKEEKEEETEEDDNFYYYNDSEAEESGKRNSWDIPVDIKRGAEEVKE
ncbi:MAG TPA: hypothetical protein VKO42_04315 [Patescibacteria group bacterium]|nr:hypothetical protein [Patescibacteria group bacterium]